MLDLPPMTPATQSSDPGDHPPPPRIPTKPCPPPPHPTSSFPRQAAPQIQSLCNSPPLATSTATAAVVVGEGDWRFGDLSEDGVRGS
ncbi:hypothetical protein TIFTF001_010129 [Ficus carica]|uniref:Uncharacterized protein n=1 Tax=Ficus carica TaxID=3494 RepID=A0AA87ZUZ0_FICCA|nr:hypothetical protein TIFTF001_010129 [Ficus carica]